MPAKRVLLLDATGLTAHYWNSGHIRAEGEFQSDPVGLEALAAYLQKYRSSIFYLLADVAEEGFHLEDIPYVQGGDRNALLQRRLSQYFYGTSLSVALSLGRAKVGRRDEKVLFAALTRGEAFTPWLDTLRSAEAILAGVYSVPLLLANSGQNLVQTSTPSLLVTITRGGIRQSFFNQGKLHFSRLSQLATRSLEEVAVACSGESAKIQQYLIGQRQIPRGTVLQTRVLAHSDQLPALQKHCLSSADLNFEFTNLADTARNDGLKNAPDDNRADILFVHRLASKPPSQQFAPSTERKFFHLWQIRFALTSLAWIIFAGCLLYAGKTSLQGYELQQKTSELTMQITMDTKRYKNILDALPKVSLTPENLRSLMNRLEELSSRNPQLEPILIHLSGALDQTPKVELLRIDWRASDLKGSPAKVGASGTAPIATSEGLDVIEVIGQLPLGLSTDLRAQHDLVETFASRLRSPQFDVKVISMPFDIESGKPLKSRSDIATAQLLQAPKFSLRIVRKS